MTRPLRVLVVVSSLRENGGVRVCLDHARRWQAAGTEVLVAVVQHARDAPLAVPDPALRVRYLTAPDTRARYAAPGALVRLVGLARRADVVLGGAEEGNGLLFGHAAARAARRPFAVLAQGDLELAIGTWVPRALRGPTRWVHRHSDATICVSEGVRDSVVAHGLAPVRAHLVHNGVDRAAVRARASGVGPRPGPPTVVGCGRLAEAKNFDVLLRAHARVLAAGVDHRLRIVGEGPARPALAALVDELGVTDTVTLTGFAADAVPELAAGALLALASRSEGTPLVLLEALALARPVVATRCSPSVVDLLDDGALGTLVDVDDVGQLADAITVTLRDHREARERAARAPERLARFDAAEASARVLAVLRGVTRRG